MRPSLKAHDICDKAASLVKGDRERQHGDKSQNFGNIARLWSAWLGVEVAASDVAAMMVLLKLARTKTGSQNMDDFVDGAGYFGCMGEIMEQNGN
jgi:hypothetical protein